MGDGYIPINDRKQHPKLWLDDGNIILATKLSRFRVHRTRLAMNSPVFAKMLPMTQPDRVEDGHEGLSVVEIPDNDADFIHLLSFLYVRRYYQGGTETTFEKISGLLRMSTKYQMEDLRNEIISHLSLAYPSTLEKYSEAVSSKVPVALFPPFHGQHFAVVLLARETKASILLRAALWRSMCMPSRDIVEGAEDYIGKRYKLSPTDVQRCILLKNEVYKTLVQTEILLTAKLNGTECRRPLNSNRVTNVPPCVEAAMDTVVHHFSNSGPEIRDDHDMLTQLNVFQVWRPLVCDGCGKAADSELSRLRTSWWNSLPRELTKMGSYTASNLATKCKVWAADSMIQVVRFAMHSFLNIDWSMDSNNTHIPIKGRKPKLWLEDGNIVLTTNASRFRVHRSVLSENSVVFADMLSMPVPTPLPDADSIETTFEGLPVVEISDNDADFTHLMCYFYEHKYYQAGTETTFEKISGLLRLSSKYEMEELRDEIISHLSLAYPTTFEKYSAAVDTKSQVALFPPFHGQHFAIVELARETDASVLLPAALWRSMCMTSRDILQGGMDSRWTRYMLHQSDVLKCLVNKSMVYKKLVRVEYTMAMTVKQSEFQCLRRRAISPCFEIAVSTFFHHFSLARAGPTMRDDNDLLTHTDAFETWRPLVCDNCGKVADSRLSKFRATEWSLLPQLFDLPEWSS